MTTDGTFRMISQDTLTACSRYTHQPGGCIYRYNTSDRWDIPWNTMRKRSISIVHHVIVANIIIVTYI